MEIIKTPDFKHIYQVKPFAKEFNGAVGGDARIRKRCESWLRRSLNLLDEFGREAVSPGLFDKITDEIYEIKYPNSKKNPRVYYFYFNGNSVLLLSAFSDHDHEKAKKKVAERLKVVRRECKI